MEANAAMLATLYVRKTDDGSIGKAKRVVKSGGSSSLRFIAVYKFLHFFITRFTRETWSFRFKKNYCTYFGLAFVFSVTFLFATTLNAFWKVFLGHWLKEKASVYFYQKEAYDLTNEEKGILNIFIKGKTRSTSLSMKNGVVLGLEKRMFIVRVGQLGTDAISWSFPFSMQPWAWEFLNKNPHLLNIEE